MLHYYKFAPTVFDPAPARETYQKRRAGRGWPEECPPLRAANAHGWDVLANFDMEFVRRRDGSWRLEKEETVEADWGWDGRSLVPRHVHGDECAHADGESGSPPLTQVNAWFWEKGQKLPHEISGHVHRALRNQVKVSTYLFLATDPNELLLMTDVPNQWRPFRALSAIVDTDWYAASYPWHCMLELDPREKRVKIAKGTPVCRLMIVARAHWFAREMNDFEFETFFARSQRWMKKNGRGNRPDMLDITAAYGRQQRRARFDVTF